VLHRFELTEAELPERSAVRRPMALILGEDIPLRASLS